MNKFEPFDFTVAARDRCKSSKKEGLGNLGLQSRRFLTESSSLYPSHVQIVEVKEVLDDNSVLNREHLYFSKRS